MVTELTTSFDARRARACHAIALTPSHRPIIRRRPHPHAPPLSFAPKLALSDPHSADSPRQLSLNNAMLAYTARRCRSRARRRTCR